MEEKLRIGSDTISQHPRADRRGGKTKGEY